jgi:hypothetical protein
MALLCGREILRPPLLNPKEETWSPKKGHATRNNMTLTLQKVWEMTECIRLCQARGKTVFFYDLQEADVACKCDSGSIPGTSDQQW